MNGLYRYIATFGYFPTYDTDSTQIFLRVTFAKYQCLALYDNWLNKLLGEESLKRRFVLPFIDSENEFGNMSEEEKQDIESKTMVDLMAHLIPARDQLKKIIAEEAKIIYEV